MGAFLRLGAGHGVYQGRKIGGVHAGGHAGGFDLPCMPAVAVFRPMPGGLAHGVGVGMGEWGKRLHGAILIFHPISPRLAHPPLISSPRQPLAVFVTTLSPHWHEVAW